MVRMFLLGPFSCTPHFYIGRLIEFLQVVLTLLRFVKNGTALSYYIEYSKGGYQLRKAL
jgi:hypothetical protein